MKKSIRITLVAMMSALMLMLSACMPDSGLYVDSSSLLSVHFIDVGQADAALLISDGESMLIDGGNAEDSSLIYSYLNDCNVEHLNYIIGTHAHEDHIGGLSAALNKASVGRIYIPEVGNDALFYKKFIEKAKEEEIEILVPEKNEKFLLGSCEVELITPSFVDEEELNNTSIMAKVSCGDVSFLFTGDAEREEELDIIDQGYDLNATILKAGHHGSDTSSSYPFLREVMPEVVVISVGENNSYSHPHKEVLSRFDDLGAKVYRTDESGHIVIRTDGKSFSVEPRKKESTQTPEVQENVTGSYVGNIGSKKLHLPTCSNLPKEENRVYFASRDEAIAFGYSPCKGCNP